MAYSLYMQHHIVDKHTGKRDKKDQTDLHLALVQENETI